MHEGERVAGLRTFTLIALLGAVSVMVVPGSIAFPTAIGTVVGIVLTAGYWRESAQSGDVGITTTIAAILTFGLGALAGTGEIGVPASVAVVAALLLSFKPELHSLLQRIKRDELLATFRLLLISIVLLPILPNRGFGPWEALNPYQIWLMVVLIALFSYIGYLGVKWLGERRAVLTTSLLGSIVSSTAVTISLARMAEQDTVDRNVLGGILLASAVMFPRIIAIVVAVTGGWIGPLAWPLMAAGVVAFALGVWFTARDREERADQRVGGRVELRNPLELRTALEFGALLALIMLLSRAALAYGGGLGLQAMGASAGLIGVDAISLSIGTMMRENQTAAPPAISAILLAALINTLVKPLIVLAVSGGRSRMRLAGLTALWLTVPLIVGGIVFAMLE